MGNSRIRWSPPGRDSGKWDDDDLVDVLYIRRTIWGTSLKEQSKTGEDEDEPGMVPIIEPLRKLLDAVKPSHGFIFTGSRDAALDLENLADRVMKPILKAGYTALRLLRPLFRLGPRTLVAFSQRAQIASNAAAARWAGSWSF